MKHLLNNLTEEEKNSIRGQHTGGMTVVNENFSKLVNTKSGNVKTLVEQANPTQPTPSPSPVSHQSPFKSLTGQGTWVVKDGKINFSDSTGKVVLALQV